MIVHLLHGIHTSPTSRRMADLAPVVERASGIRTVYHEYGDILAIQTRYKNPQIAKQLLPLVGPDDVLVGHSNGNAIWLRVLQMGAPARGFVALNAALDENTIFPPQLQWARVYFNQDDEAVPIAAWTKGLWLDQLLVDPLWGDMGSVGYKGSDNRVTNINEQIQAGLPQLKGHSAIINPPDAVTWAMEWGRVIGLLMK